MITYIAISAGFLVMFMLLLGIGLIVRGRSGIKGHCSGSSCVCDGGKPEHSISPCKRTIHVPQK